MAVCFPGSPLTCRAVVSVQEGVFRGVSLTLQGRINSIANFPHSQLSRARPHNSIALSRADSEKLHSFVWSRDDFLIAEDGGTTIADATVAALRAAFDRGVGRPRGL